MLPDARVGDDIRHGFVYERVPHITLKSIANNAEIDVIHDKWQAVLEPLREALNKALKKKWEEWEIPRDADGSWPADAAKADDTCAATFLSRYGRLLVRRPLEQEELSRNVADAARATATTGDFYAGLQFALQQNASIAMQDLDLRLAVTHEAEVAVGQLGHRGVEFIDPYLIARLAEGSQNTDAKTD